MPRHLIETKVQISTLRSLGKSWGDIEKITGVRRSTAQAIVAKREKTDSHANKKSSGRPKKLSVRDVRCLKRSDQYIELQCKKYCFVTNS